MLHVMQRYILPQPISQRQVQPKFSQPITDLDVGTSAVHKPRKRSFSQFDRESEQDVDTFKGRLLGVEDDLILAVHPRPQEWNRPQVHLESDKDVDKFKGRLLGVEDGMIDAIGSEPCLGHRNRQGALDSSHNFPWYSQAEVRMPERQLLLSTERTSDTLSFATHRHAKAFADSSTFQTPVSLSAHLHPDLGNHKRGSMVDSCTAANPVLCPFEVVSYHDSIGNDNRELNAQCSKCVWTPREPDYATALYDTPSNPTVQAPSPSMCEPDLPEAIDTPTELDEIIVDTKMIDRSVDELSLGTWDLSNWQTLEFTISDLLVVRK